ncbi:HutD/Ves family protein [Burkholderia alba]|uniref:HutD/Ves family protein n=1 Tax=Burkholderia alba TaxID=2683677 RepID=UPI002B056DDC|nr:HutD family protein [Burkholderia alba]
MAAAIAPRATLIRADQLVASPWKNGGGVTREIAAGAPRARAPEGDATTAGAAYDGFAWRVSVAEVAQPGPFSRFDGIDRTLVLLSGAGMTLVEDGGARHVLDRPLDRLEFAGETPLRAELHDGPTRDFNLMVRRGAAQGSVAAWRAGARYELSADTALLFCVTGALTVATSDGAAHALAAFDTLRLDGIAPGLHCIVSGEGTLLAVCLSSPHRTATT